MAAQAPPAELTPADLVVDFLKDTESRVGAYVLELGGWTAAEYFEKAPENRFCEFWEGTVVVYSPAWPRHQLVLGFLMSLLSVYTSARQLGEVLIGPAVARLREDVYVAPDIFFVPSAARSSIREMYVDGPPAFIVEVLSPSTRRRDLVDKVEMYRSAGVVEYWAIDGHSEEVRVYVNRPEPSESLVKSGRLESVAVQGFSIDVGWLWQDPLPPDAELVKQYL